MIKLRPLFEDNILSEMATLFNKDKFHVFVNGHDGKEPHIHIEKIGEYHVCYSMKQDKIIEWKFGQDKYNDIPTKDKKKIKTLLILKYPGFNETTWEFAIKYWNANN